MKLPPFIRRLLAITILCSVIAIAWYMAVSPLANYISSTRQEIAFAHAKASHYQALQGAMARIQATLKVAKAVYPDQEIFLQGNNATLLSAEFQKTIVQIASKADVDLASSQTTAAHQQRQFIHLGLEIELTTSVASLHRFLYSIESNTPLIFVDRVSIRVPESGFFLGKSSDGQPLLRVSIELTSYAKSAASSAYR